MTDVGKRTELRWLQDIDEAIRKIHGHEQYANGRAAFESDEHYRVWVFYFIERIGECASRLRRDFDYDTLHPEIDWSGAQAMRRYLVHRYWSIDKDQVWMGVEYLSVMKQRVAELIRDKGSVG